MRPMMLYDASVLPGGSYPRPTRSSSPSKIVGEVVQGLRQPSRLRGRMVVTVLVGGAMLVFMFLTRRHDINYREYVSRIKGFNPLSAIDTTRWSDEADNTIDESHIVTKKPKFHLLIPMSQPTANTCKTILSAAILNYPPPTLVNYGAFGEEEKPGWQAMQNTQKFLHGKETRENDLVLVVHEDTWLQLPAEVMVQRYIQNQLESDIRLIKKYGHMTPRSGVNTTNTSSAVMEEVLSRPQTYSVKTVFGADKQCIDHDAGDLACNAIPESTLADDLYGSRTDKELNSTRPRFLNSHVGIGRVSDLKIVYQAALDRLEKAELGFTSQWALSQGFGEQEAAREANYRAEMLEKAGTWSKWWLRKFNRKPQRDPSVKYENFTACTKHDYELGIGLDYTSRIFQTLSNATSDVQFLKFDHQDLVRSSPSSASRSLQSPLQLPPDIHCNTSLPFMQLTEPSADRVETDLVHAPEVDNLPNNKQWSEIDLATNIMVPGSTVPAALTFTGREDLLDSYWPKMWYQTYARALLRRWLRSPHGTNEAEAAAEGGSRWWDLRGGKGGVWTDRGEWLEWNEVCGEFSEEIFRDGQGVELAGGGPEREPLHNKWGN